MCLVALPTQACCFVALQSEATTTFCLSSKMLVLQVGTGGRAEKIKTYNFKDSRMSDHRTKNNYDLDKILSGAIEEPIQAMIALEQRERLAELGSS